MAKIKVEIEVLNDKYCESKDDVCPMCQEGNRGGWYCCLFGVDLEEDCDNGYYCCIRCDKCKQAEEKDDKI